VHQQKIKIPYPPLQVATRYAKILKTTKKAKLNETATFYIFLIFHEIVIVQTKKKSETENIIFLLFSFILQVLKLNWIIIRRKLLLQFPIEAAHENACPDNFLSR
jgi:hypothetical protein